MPNRMQPERPLCISSPNALNPIETVAVSRVDSTRIQLELVRWAIFFDVLY